MAGVDRFQYSATITRCFRLMGLWDILVHRGVVQLEWPESWRKVHIAVKELLPVVLGVALWGSQWLGRNIRCRCCNAAMVAILNFGSSKEDLAMHLMRNLFFFLASFNVSLYGEHIPGIENGPADALSRGNHLSFLSQVR